MRRSGMLSPMALHPGAPPDLGCSLRLSPPAAPTSSFTIHHLPIHHPHHLHPASPTPLHPVSLSNILISNISPSLLHPRAMSVSMLRPSLCQAGRVVPPRPPSLCLLQLCEKEEEEQEEEEELTERSEQDSGINEEPLLTAEQVIEELEELMQSSPDPEADPEGDEDEEDEEEEETEADAEGEGGGGGTEPIILRELHAFSPAFNKNCSYEGLGRLSARELAAAAGRAEAASRALSAELVAQLARRDELAFEKEVKTAFIGALLAVQGEQREQREAARRRRRDKGLSLQGGRPERGNHMPRKRFSMEGISSILHSGLRQTFGPAASEKQYLNTVIPYEKKGSPPSVEDLQMLTNILFAMKEGNEKVPTLLTDYILKVLCPT
ncbi:fasciculation and elongation protein zeta-1 isoform X4 [Cuculus canorus]|uniref:fasciculation and elongation protein zeta-1 isoform X4 n=1 Tax=Cuculus canorus TaxID=55661 RepID=UPI0023AB1201|nr:fasciculation and elongation protein zeta-1 isoform X4 [Cuculus canorus]